MLQTAIVLGATGLTGGLLTERLMKDEGFDKIILFTRRSTGFQHPKIQEVLCDLLDVETFKDQFYGDVVFCCIGTTKAQTPDKEKYKAIDYGIPIATAKLAKKHGIPRYLVMSSLGADPKSSTFYSKVKGEMERDLLALDIPHTYIMQPSLIGGNREDKRLGEYVAKKMFQFINPLLMGPLKKYRSIEPIVIAKGLHYLAKNDFARKHVESDEIKRLAARM